MTVDPKTLGERLALVRSRRDWGIRIVAQGAGISEARLYRIEQGDVWPEPAVLARICQALGVDEVPLREEGEEWYRRLKGIGAISGPHVFDLPTQFDPALQIEGTVAPDPGVRDADERPRLPAPVKAEPQQPLNRRGFVIPASARCTRCGQRPRYFGFQLCSECLR